MGKPSLRPVYEQPIAVDEGVVDEIGLEVELIERLTRLGFSDEQIDLVLQSLKGMLLSKARAT